MCGLAEVIYAVRRLKQGGRRKRTIGASTRVRQGKRRREERGGKKKGKVILYLTLQLQFESKNGGDRKAEKKSLQRISKGGKKKKGAVSPPWYPYRQGG